MFGLTPTPLPRIDGHGALARLVRQHFVSLGLSEGEALVWAQYYAMACRWRVSRARLWRAGIRHIPVVLSKYFEMDAGNFGLTQAGVELLQQLKSNKKKDTHEKTEEND